MLNLILDVDKELQKFFQYELNNLIQKYKSITEESTQKLIHLLEKLEDSDFKDLIFDDLETALELEKEGIDVAKLYLWFKSENRYKSIEEIKSIVYSLKSNGYVEIDNLLLVYENAELSEYTRDKLCDLLEDAYYVRDFFTPEELADMWIYETSKEDAIRDLMKNFSSIEEMLDIVLDEICILENGTSILVGEIDF